MDISNLLQKHGKGGKDTTTSKMKGNVSAYRLRLITIDYIGFERVRNLD